MGKLKQSEKSIIYILIMIVVVFCAWFFGYRNIDNMYKKVNDEVQVLIDKNTSLKNMAANANNFAKQTVEFDTKTEELFKIYDSGFSQEYTVKFLEGIENQTNTWIKSATLKESAKIFTFGNILSSNPNNPGVKVYKTDMTGYSTTTTVNFQGNYEETKAMIDYILDNQYKCTLENFNVSYNVESDMVTGSFVIGQYAIVSNDREFEGPHINNGNFGTDNIFSSSIFSPSGDQNSNGSNIMSDYDIFIQMNGYGSDVGAFRMGMKDDAIGTTVISSEENKPVDVTIRVTGKAGDYKISYKVGNVTYPVDGYSNGVSFNPGNLLSIFVASSQRGDLNDKSGANVTLINDSDMTLEVKVVAEDSNDPRFKIKHKSGDIIVYEN